MLCPNCKKWDLLPDDEFCSWCRRAAPRAAALLPDNATTISIGPPPGPKPFVAPPPPPPPVPKPKPSHGGRWVLALLLLTAAAAGAFYEWPRLLPAPKIESFAADHDVIQSGQSVTLRWSVSGAAQVNIDPLGSLPPRGEQTISPAQTAVYLLTARNLTGSASAKIQVQVQEPTPPPNGTPGQTPSTSPPDGNSVSPPEIKSFTSDRSPIVRGESTELRFEVTGATRLSIEPAVGEIPVDSRSVRVSPATDTEYVLTAENSAGSVKSNPVSIQVKELPPPTAPAAPTIDFSGDASEIEFGRTVKLRWKCANATAVRIDPGFPGLSAEGEVTVTPGSTSEYRITAEGPGGTRAQSFQVRVDPRIVSFDSFPISSKGCDFAILRWKVDGAQSIAIDHGVGDVTSSPWVRVRPLQATTYTLTAERAGGASKRVWSLPAFVPNSACSF